MMSGGIPGTSPFRGFVPYDESSAGLFFGRGAETSALLDQVTRDGARATALVGEAGVGKTSLVRAGVSPVLARHGVLVLTIGSYPAFHQELWKAASRASAEAPAAGEGAGDYLVRLARASRGGALLVLDHVETLLSSDAAEPVGDLARLLGAAAAAAGPRLRLLFSVEAGSFHRLDALVAASGLSPAPGSWLELGRLTEPQVAEIVEQTALQTGTVFEAGLAKVVAADLCREGPCLPLDLQTVARALVDLRLTGIRRYERSGGAEALIHGFFERVAKAGGKEAGRVLQAIATTAGGVPADELVARTRLPRPVVDRALAGFAGYGIVAPQEGDRADRHHLVHPRLADRVAAWAALYEARAKQARRTLRRRLVSATRLSLVEVRAVRRYLGRALAPDEAAVVTRSVRRMIVHLALGTALVAGLVFALLFDVRASYSLAIVPWGPGGLRVQGPMATPGAAQNARVVVRKGRPPSFFSFPGAVLADTGFSATGVARDLATRIADGRATGPLADDRPGVPGWLRMVVAGLGPVQRGVTLMVLGDGNGVVSLKQAFADPRLRLHAMEALAVIGSGGAGEDEILAAALADPSAEVRRRSVEVAAAIDRRRGKGAHGAVLSSALGDRSFEVRAAALRECATLDPAVASRVLSVALADRDSGFRRLAESVVLDLAQRAPSAAADTVRLALRSADASARRASMALLEQIVARTPEEAATALTQVVAEKDAPEEARVFALHLLRRSGASPAKLQPLLEQAVGPESSPRLRAAALPLYVRLIDPATAAEIAAVESRGSAAVRATGAAVWGALAITQPEAAGKALKAFVYDPSPEVRMEAARAYGYLKREGATLIQKALVDTNAEVQRAAIESAVILAPAQPYAAPEALGRALPNVRPAARRLIVEALGRIGQDRPNTVLPALARTLRESDGVTRATAATTLCHIAKKSAAATAPYLRLAARDADRDVRAAAASCLDSLAQGDPKSAARIAAELAVADEAAVRAAAASSLGALAPKARETTLAPLLKLAQDADRGVRLAAVGGLAAYGAAHAPLGKRADEVERTLSAVLVQGDAEERAFAIRAAARGGLPGVLREAVGNTEAATRLEVVRTAASMTPPALDIVQSAVDDSDPTVRAEAISRLAAVSGAGAQNVLPVFEAMLASGDSAMRRAGATALGSLEGAGEAAVRLLAAAMLRPGEGVRAAAAEALGRLAERTPDPAMAALERARDDPAPDVRMAAIRGLGGAWARRRSADEVAAALVSSEGDSARRLVALEALVVQAQGGATKVDAEKALGRIATQGPALARLAAQIGRAFLGASTAEMHAFLEKLLGG